MRHRRERLRSLNTTIMTMNESQDVSLPYSEYTMSNASSFLRQHQNRNRKAIFNSLKADIMKTCFKVENQFNEIKLI